MAIHNLISLSNSNPILLSPYGTHSGVDITIQNVNSDGYIYIGSNDDISSTDFGYRISPNHAISFELPGTDSIYAVGSTTNLKAAVMITNLEHGA